MKKNNAPPSEERSLSNAILSIMRSRQITATRIASKMKSGRNRATLYRILSGTTQDPKVSTFVDICQALEVSPIDVLQLAGMVAYQQRETEMLEIRMRQIFRQVQNLPAEPRALAVAQLGALVDTLSEYAEQRAGDAQEAEQQEEIPVSAPEDSQPDA